jgi:flagellar hook-length control protein FliK
VIKLMDQEGFLGVPSQARQMSVAQGIGAVAGDGTETARLAAQQIETAVFKGNSKTTEIALNPEELGRVRLTLTAINGALTLVVLTDRPEIQELLRRHIDVLAQEFKALRYESVSFYFNADGQSGDNERSA